ncbi:hypothetical protein EIKCOROL_00190 [Eikenella corrodens ATCC 23834]|uniref:Uncharacterized protein n=1 Tax=Eikenella corrodens ATCC 23834 TaxID=546274 RepID=C0DS68_EIKCO|nr:hypothetical protein EIKCOROL_00190 [Eikenella corrodens ATCC 23834]
MRYNPFYCRFCGSQSFSFAETSFSGSLLKGLPENRLKHLRIT